MTGPRPLAPDWPAILDSWRAGAISPEVTLARLLLAGGTDLSSRLAELARDDPSLRPLAGHAQERASALLRLEALHLPALLADAGGPDSGRTDARSAEGAGGRGAERGLARVRRTFDHLARALPAAGVALYSLGEPELLGRATDELVAVVRAWTQVTGARVLDFGCGIGRLAVALAPEAAQVTGVDLSPAMVAEALRRTRDLANVAILQTDGRDLSGLADSSFDLALAVDSFPYLVQAGGGLLELQMRELARVLGPSAELLVFNWSYRGDIGRDVAEARALAAAHGFTVPRAGESPFALWDGRGFHLRRRG